MKTTPAGGGKKNEKGPLAFRSLCVQPPRVNGKMKDEELHQQKNEF